MPNNKEIMESTYRYFKEQGCRINKKDIALYLECYEKQDYSEMFKTNLYIKKGVLYCRMLEAINCFRSNNDIYKRGYII